MKEFIKNRLRESLTSHLISEGMSNIVYHFTHFSSLLNITKENKFHASTNIGSTADLNTSKNKFFFFSTTRSRGTGFTKGNVKFVLNGQKLNQKYKSFPIDYWNYSTNPKDWGDVENNPKDKASYMQALQSKEMEDRIVLDNPTIDNASNYIVEIHILLDKNNIRYETKKDVEYIMSDYKAKNIPVYFYTEKKYFLNETKAKSVNPLSLEGYIENKEEYNSGYKSLYFIFRVATLLSYKDENNFNKIIKEFDKNNDGKLADSLKEQIQKDEYNYLKYPDKFGMSEYGSVIGAEVHNARSKPDNDIRFIMKMLADDMKKWNAKNLNDYIQYKTGYKKSEINSNEKPQYGLFDTQMNREIPWDKRAWFYLTQEELWNLLPEKYKNDTRFVKMLNNNEAKFDYVYNFLNKNINKNFADNAFKTVDLEIRKLN